MASPKPSPVRSAFFSLIGLCAAGVLLGGWPAKAQNRGPVMRAPVQVRQMPVRVAPTRPQAAHIVSAVPAVRPFDGTVERSQNRTVTRTFPRGHTNGNRSFQNRPGCAFGTSAQQLLSPVPPYGFNYEYLNAIDKDLNIKAVIDPATQLALREAARFGCSGFAGGGYIIWDGGGYAPVEQVEEQPQESAPASQPQVIVVQVPAAAQSAPAKAPAAAQTEEEQAPPLPDIGQFILVMRDGTQLKAAAFTRSNDQIIYITPDGVRHNMAVTDLDTDATLRVNSERGSQLQLSL
ncbi:MAG TPA: hypothetical protein VJS43_13070 [Candidatus Acidoferrales bacterium]|nr:hypothetical protein [Candidatus Acidoferrales bacterium]